MNTVMGRRLRSSLLVYAIDRVGHLPDALVWCGPRTPALLPPPGCEAASALQVSDHDD